MTAADDSREEITETFAGMSPGGRETTLIKELRARLEPDRARCEKSVIHLSILSG